MLCDLPTRFAAGQEDGEKTAPSICECMDLRVAPASRAANRLLLLPPFHPLGITNTKAFVTATEKPSDQIIDLAA
jgi:hypothetical protein